jgi:hypothetical protein
MGFVIDGETEEVQAGETTVPLACLSWRDDARIPRLSRARDAQPRSTRWVRSIVLHTTKGIPGGGDRRPQQIRAGLGPESDRDVKVARYWSTSAERSGAHLIVDADGSIVCTGDLLTECAYHAGPVNDVSIGVEIYQGNDAELYEGQLDVTVALVDWLTRRFGIQRQIPHRYAGPLPRFGAGARNAVGVYGHRDVTSARGIGDPGDEIFDRLAAAGYERRDFGRGEDLEVWRQRQEELMAASGERLDLDGIPGPGTLRALLAAGRPRGQWVARPGD